MPVRRPAVAGQFYPSIPNELRESITKSFHHKMGPGKLPPSDEDFGKIVGLLSPHAGYMYSGPIAAHGYYALSSVNDVELYIIVGPNHYGIGSGVATFKEGSWITPLGEVEVDSAASRELVIESGIVDFDDTAFQREHSLEVQVPFLQHIAKRFKILPIALTLQDKNTAVEVGEAIAEITRGRRSLMIASSDFTHYEAHETAYKKDNELLKAVVAMDVTRFYAVLERLNVTACGYGAVAAVMTASKLLGASQARLLKYGTSGDTSGDYSSVVGYASALFT